MQRVIGKILVLFVIIAVLLLVTSGCEKKSTGPQNSPPIIESISYSPVSINPGGDFEVEAVISDPDGDSLSVEWSTWENAGWFWNPNSPTTTVIVNNKLDPGMKLLTAIKVSDGLHSVVDSQWISLINGVDITGHAYFNGTHIPIYGVEITIRRRTDTTNVYGEYLLEHIQPGERIITTIKTNCGDIEDTLMVDSTESLVMTHDFYLDCPSSLREISGNISSFDAINLENVRVTVLNDDLTPTGLTSLTDNLGNFSIANVPVGNRVLKIEDGDEVVNPILSKTIDLLLLSDTTLDITAKIRRFLYNSNGIEDQANWVTIGWTVDTDNASYHFNSCGPGGGFAILTMIEGAFIPADAEAVLYEIDANVSSASLTITFYVDDIPTNYGEEFRNQTGDLLIQDFIDIPNFDPSNKTLKLEFWGMSTGNDCAEISIRNISLFYYR